MNDTPRQKLSKEAPPPPMKKPLMISVALHVVVFALAVFGIPHFKKDITLTESVPVELVTNPSELTTSNKPPVKAPPKEDKKPDPPKPAPAKPVQQDQAAATPPDQSELKDPPKKVEEEKPDAILPTKKPEKKPEPKKEPPKPIKKPTPKPVEKKDNKNDFNALLKNLSPDKEAPPPDADAKPTPKNATPTASPNVSKFSDVLSISEQDALRQQLSGCWNIMAGAQNAEDIAVEIRVVVNQDRTVQSVELVDKSRYNSGDSFYRAAADSALRAVRNPNCTPLNLPPDKYDQWHEMTIVFDPKDMF